MRDHHLHSVMPGLDPDIHVLKHIDGQQT